MQKKYILSGLALAVVIIAGISAYKVYAEKNNGIAAIVNGEQITVAQIKEAYEQNPQLKAQVPFEEFYNRALEVMVNSKLALQAANAAKVQETEEYKKQLENMQEELARQIYIEQQVDARVTPEAVKKVYDDYVNNFKSEKEIHAKHILVETEAEAKDIIEQLKSKKSSFEDLALKKSKDQPDLGYFTEEMMVPEFSKAAFALKKGSYTQTPVKTEFGYHVILVEDIRDTKPLALEAVEPQIKNTLSQQAVAQVVQDLNSNAQIEKYDLKGKKIENPSVPQK